MSTTNSSTGSLRNASQVQRVGLPTKPSIEKLQRSSGVLGVGPADSTGKSAVKYCPGGIRLASCASRRLPTKPRETNGLSNFALLFPTEIRVGLNRAAPANPPLLRRHHPLASPRQDHLILAAEARRGRAPLQQPVGKRRPLRRAGSSHPRAQPGSRQLRNRPSALRESLRRRLGP